MNNQRTVTIKMTRVQALRLCRLITSYVFSNTIEGTADEWREIHDKVRAGVDKLDKEGAKDK